MAEGVRGCEKFGKHWSIPMVEPYKKRTKSEQINKTGQAKCIWNTPWEVWRWYKTVLQPESNTSVPSGIKALDLLGVRFTTKKLAFLCFESIHLFFLLQMHTKAPFKNSWWGLALLQSCINCYFISRWSNWRCAI